MRHLAALALLFALPACGISYGQQVQHADLGHYQGDFNIEGDPAYEGDTSMDIRGHSLTIHDTSGLLLAGVAGAGSKYSAQKAAETAAIERGGKPGDTYSYEYNVYQPVPGKLTTLRYSWGNGVGATNSLADASAATTSYFEFDLTAGLKTWYMGQGDLSLTLGGGWQNWKVSGIPGALFAVDENRFSMPIALSYGYLVLPRVHASVRASWDTLSPFTYLEGPNHLDYGVGAHVSAKVFRWLKVYADASYGRFPIEFGKRAGAQSQASLNLLFWWEGPKFWTGGT